MRECKNNYVIVATWNDGKCLELIKEYEKHEVLWQPKFPVSDKADMVKNAWRELSNTMKKSETEIKKKVFQLRKSFNREYRRRFKNNKNTGK